MLTKTTIVILVILVLGAALLLGSWLVLFRRENAADLGASGKAGDPGAPNAKKEWDPADIPGSLQGLAADMEKAAVAAADWYWTEKRGKARASRFIQSASVFLGVAAGLVPVAVEIAAKFMEVTTAPWWVTGLWASVLVGAAAGLLGLDRAFGFSSGWTRYVLAATEITRRLTEFKMTWLSLVATLPKDTTPSAEQVAKFIQTATDFRLAVAGVVVQETKEWATEFQNNMAQLEKDVKAQLESLKVQVEQHRKEREAATQAGSIEATVSNADKAKDFTFLVSLEGPDGTIVTEDPVVRSKTWTRLGLKPDQYKITLAADTVGPPSVRKSKTAVVIVKPGEVAKPPIDLPLD